MLSSDYNIQPPLDTARFDVGQISQDLAGSSLFPWMTVCRMLALRPHGAPANWIRSIWKSWCEYLCLL